MRNSALRCFAIAVLSLAVGSLNGQDAAHSKKVQDFDIEGVALWECQCPAYGCPCQRNGRPTHGTCHGSDFAHISKGHYGDVKLDGFNVGMVGNLVDANSDRLFATLYFDDKATDEQRAALTRIVEYMNGAYKNTPIAERLKFQIRFEFFNLFNHPNLYLDNNMANGTFGKAISQQLPRWWQIGGKLSF